MNSFTNIFGCTRWRHCNSMRGAETNKLEIDCVISLMRSIQNTDSNDFEWIVWKICNIVTILQIYAAPSGAALAWIPAFRSSTAISYQLWAGKLPETDSICNLSIVLIFLSISPLRLLPLITLMSLLFHAGRVRLTILKNRDRMACRYDTTVLLLLLLLLPLPMHP